MWKEIKEGFGYAFGGRLGWEFGGMFYRMIRKVMVWTFVFATTIGLSLLSHHNHQKELAVAAKGKPLQNQKYSGK